jgi:hypothetical protein
MNTLLASALRRARVAALLASLTAAAALAAPGAHGPDGEHLDEKSAAAAGASLPRVEAKSELFELVANLKGGELTILVDRYESNEPVLGAKLEVESGPLKAVAAFRADSGDYAVTDAALLKALAAPGEHALVFTLVAGEQADLLDGTLLIAGGAAAADGHGHSHGADGDAHGHHHEIERAAWIGVGVLVLGLISGVAWWRQRRREGRVASKGVQS